MNGWAMADKRCSEAGIGRSIFISFLLKQVPISATLRVHAKISGSVLLSSAMIRTLESVSPLINLLWQEPIPIGFIQISIYYA
jgi:hypothetical protein